MPFKLNDKRQYKEIELRVFGGVFFFTGDDPTVTPLTAEQIWKAADDALASLRRIHSIHLSERKTPR